MLHLNNAIFFLTNLHRIVRRLKSLPTKSKSRSFFVSPTSILLQHQMLIYHGNPIFAARVSDYETYCHNRDKSLVHRSSCQTHVCSRGRLMRLWKSDQRSYAHSRRHCQAASRRLAKARALAKTVKKAWTAPRTRADAESLINHSVLCPKVPSKTLVRVLDRKIPL